MSKLALESIEFDDDKIYFMYRCNGILVKRGLDFHGRVHFRDWQEDGGFMRLVQYCALMYAVYFYSVAFFDEVSVFFALDEQEKIFFESTFTRGLAEYKYQNNLAVDREVRIKSEGDSPKDIAPLQAQQKNTALVMNGGGKDGAVGMELARGVGLETAWFSLNDTPSRTRIVEASGNDKSIIVTRIVDDFVKEHTQLPGHKPMSAYVGLVAVLVAYLERKKYIVVSSELSADAANIVIDGFEVNHQYSKSSTFEKLLQSLFTDKGYDQAYFSIIRPLYELQVMKIFTRLPAYHQHFLSCNVGTAEDRWCLDCSKCAFVVAAFYALDEKAATAIWGPATILSDGSFQKHIIELINPDLKPFECIGTTAESFYIVNELLDRRLLVIEDETLVQTLHRYMSRITPQQRFDMTHVSRGHDSFPPEICDELFSRIHRLLIVDEKA